jgi:K+-sensing histidine kinase KdpD
VLDIAKIESGQFTLSMAKYAIESVVETVRSATEWKQSLKTEVAIPKFFSGRNSKCSWL